MMRKFLANCPRERKLATSWFNFKRNDAQRDSSAVIHAATPRHAGLRFPPRMGKSTTRGRRGRNARMEAIRHALFTTLFPRNRQARHTRWQFGRAAVLSASQSDVNANTNAFKPALSLSLPLYPLFYSRDSSLVAFFSSRFGPRTSSLAIRGR